MIKAVVFALLLAASLALPEADKVSSPPGMHEAVIYSGFLDTSISTRKMHYVYVQANVSDPSTAPLTVWLNGGPGCSSLIGMLQEIGPYTIDNTYKQGDILTKNDYAWTKISNVLFLQSPAIVGFSSESDSRYEWTDQQTTADAYAALKDFIFVKAPEFTNSTLYLTGEDYAGKYIPDLAYKILLYNQAFDKNQINLKGIMVGNGVMNFQDNSMQKSKVDYLIGHSMVSNRMRSIYELSCHKDHESPRCKFAKYEIGIMQSYLNRFNIYETCLPGTSSQGNRLRELLGSRYSIRNQTHIERERSLGEIPDCSSEEGVISYWNLNKIAFHMENSSKTWSVCAKINYTVTLRGSLDEYRRMFVYGGVRIWLYNGDSDIEMPFTDTEKNVAKLNRVKAGEWTSWNVKDQHGGFFQTYDKQMTVITVKAAGHLVPQDKPKAAFQLFSNFINGKGVNNQIY